MEKFKTHTSQAIPLNIANVDTDQIIPARFLKATDKKGFGDNVFRDWRFNKAGKAVSNFSLNNPLYSGSILIAGDNFGCGSSREHAPWALLDFGVRVVISTSFADIFYSTCFKNGILPIVLDEANREELMNAAKNGSNSRITVDLENQEIIRPNGLRIAFEIEEYKKHCLLEGLDDIDLTLEKKIEIDKFEILTKDKFPWL